MQPCSVLLACTSAQWEKHRPAPPQNILSIHAALVLDKRVPRKRVIWTLMTSLWHLMAWSFDNKCTPILDWRSNCTQQKIVVGVREKKQKPEVFTYWHNSEVILLMAQWCQPDSGRCLKMAKTDEQEVGNRMQNKVRTDAYRMSIKIEQSPEPQFCNKSSKLLIAARSDRACSTQAATVLHLCKLHIHWQKKTVPALPHFTKWRL